LEFPFEKCQSNSNFRKAKIKEKSFESNPSSKSSKKSEML
jgi:hypothetical protein